MTRGTPPRRAGARLSRLLGLAGLGIGCLLLAAVAAIAVIRSGSDGPDYVMQGPSTSAMTSRDAVERPQPKPHGDKPAPPELRFARPARVEIPSIGVRAPIVPLGLNPDRTLEVPSDFDEAGWWTGGPRPGERGPAVIAGHVDSTTGPAVFYRLRELRPGSAIFVVGRDGRRVQFDVDRSEQYPKSNFPTARVYGPTRVPTLRLVTCSGDFDSSTGHYVDNTVVYATVR